MRRTPFQKSLRLYVAALSLLAFGGCAGSSGLFGGGEKSPPFRNSDLSMQDASALLATGRLAKADVLAALGPATVVKFDSGFEVWVYREKSSEPPSAKAEFVVLFAPSGFVSKTRIRPASRSATD